MTFYLSLSSAKEKKIEIPEPEKVVNKPQTQKCLLADSLLSHQTTNTNTVKMQRHLRSSLIALFLVVVQIMIDGVNSGRPPPKVDIRKCCKFGEEYKQVIAEEESNNTILTSNKRCFPSNVTNWVPKIHLPKQQKFFEPVGSAPPYINFLPDRMPECLDPILVSGNDALSLIRNGNLFVSERSIFIENDRFCVDKGMALFCLPNEERAESLVHSESDLATKTTVTIRKCCGPNAAYNSNETTCVQLLSHHPKYKDSVFNVTEPKTMKLDLLYSFPTECEKPHFVIVGEFQHEMMFDETRGVLKLGEKELTERQFCLEHTITEENATDFTSSIKIFTCAEHFSPSDPTGQKIHHVRRPQVVSRIFQVLMVLVMLF